MRQSLQEAFPSYQGAFPSLSGNSGKRKSDFKSKQGTRYKAPALTKKKTCNVVNNNNNIIAYSVQINIRI